MSTLFMCNTKYSIFITYLLTKTDYTNASCILAVSDEIIPKDYIDYLKTLNFWNKVIIVEEKNRTSNDIEEQIRSIYQDREFENVHIFTAGKMSSHLAIKFAPKAAKVILTDGSIFTKMPVIIYNNWKMSVFGSMQLPKEWVEFEFHRIDEIQLLDQRMFDGSLDKPVKNIDIQSLWFQNDGKMVEDLNRIFNLTIDIQNTQIIYCASYRAMANWITYRYEEHFTERLMKLMEGKKCLVKLHPHSNFKEQEKRFEKYPVKLLKESDIPFEVIFLNMLKKSDQECIVLTELSSVTSNLITLQNKLHANNIKLIELIAVQKDFNVPGEIEPYLKILDRYNQLYNNLRVEIPQNWDELNALLNSEHKDYQRKNNDIFSSDMDQNDFEFLKWDYINLIKENAMLKNRNPKVFKFKQYYQVLNDLLKIINRGEDINRYFHEKGIQSIAIYGTGNIAERLVELVNINITAFLLTYSGKGSSENGIPVFSAKEFVTCDICKQLYERTDAIIITPVSDETDIKELLTELKIDKRMILMKEIISYFETRNHID